MEVQVAKWRPKCDRNLDQVNRIKQQTKGQTGTREREVAAIQTDWRSAQVCRLRPHNEKRSQMPVCYSIVITIDAILVKNSMTSCKHLKLKEKQPEGVRNKSDEKRSENEKKEAAEKFSSSAWLNVNSWKHCLNVKCNKTNFARQKKTWVSIHYPFKLQQTFVNRLLYLESSKNTWTLVVLVNCNYKIC